MNHNWSATKQCLRPQSVAEISHHSVLSGDRILQCGTSSGSRHKDTDQCLQVPISFCRHCSVPVPCKNASVKETTVAEGGHNPVANKYLWTDPRRLHNFYYILWHSVWILDRFRPKFNHWSHNNQLSKFHETASRNHENKQTQQNKSLRRWL